MRTYEEADDVDDEEMPTKTVMKLIKDYDAAGDDIRRRLSKSENSAAADDSCNDDDANNIT